VDKLIFPYGTADYYSIITEKNVYIDRTSYIPLLEEKGRTLVFLRPRRFGKSLLISMLENYYDVRKADEFDRLFGHLAIGKNPTPRRNGYFVLRWNFSAVETSGDTEQLRQKLYNHMNQTMESFSWRYEGMFKHTIQVNTGDALATFQSLLANVQTTSYPLYLFIDEYDNFANKVLMAQHTGALERYLGLVQGEGLLKTLFQVVKYAMEGQGLERVFITGVSPIVLHDMTSSFNIAKNITFNPIFNQLCGFSETEITGLLEQVGQVCRFSPQQVQDALVMMRRYYNGYRFTVDQHTPLYNPTLVHYFLDYLQEQCQYPEEMLDNNLRTDGEKIAYVIGQPNGTQVITAILNEAEPLVIHKLVQQFGVQDMLTGEQEGAFFESLLYYMGVLTLGGRTDLGRLRLPIPNLVIRGLYVEQIRSLMLPSGTDQEATQIATEFYNYADMESLCAFIERTYFTVLDNRDYRWANELTIKMVFLTLLYSELFYIMDSEPALQRRYADLVMLVRPQMRQYKVLDFLMEFKYISLAEVKRSGEQVRKMSREELAALPAVAALLDDANTELDGYRDTLIATYGDILRLRCFSVVAVGYERLVWREV
jgi:hypothetical protein